MDEESVLGRVTDPTALDEERGAVAEYETFAPREWAGRRARLELPRSVRCRTCGGGGCDGCDRRGAFRLADASSSRAIDLDVPALGAAKVAVRIPHPFGDTSPLRQLIVVVEERVEPDPRLRLVGVSPETRRHGARGAGSWIGLGATVLLALALVAGLVRLLLAG